MTSTPALCLQLACALFWVLTYILIIKKGWQDQNYGMPMLALAANLSWEFIFSLLLPLPTPQKYIVVVWFGLDLIILMQFLLFGRTNFKQEFYRANFYSLFILTLIISFFTIFLITHEFNDYLGKYTAFGQNLMMSILFIHLLVRRSNSSGQSLVIAGCKLLGTLAASILFLLYHPSALIIFFAGAIFFFDAIYLVMLYYVDEIFK